VRIHRSILLNAAGVREPRPGDTGEFVVVFLRPRTKAERPIRNTDCFEDANLPGEIREDRDDHATVGRTGH
jgi:hypothetical protein